MNNEQYVSPKYITKKYDLTSATLVRWSDQGKIKFIKTTGKRLYNISDINKILGVQSNTRYRVCYARVSSSHQKEDLTRQIDVLKQQYPDIEVISDIGSALNWKRKGLCSLLERVYKGEISEVVVSYKDRLCRFGLELIEWIFKQHNTKLVVLNNLLEKQNSNTELAEDVLAIINYFVASNNGSRAAKYRKERKLKATKTIETTKTTETTGTKETTTN